MDLSEVSIAGSVCVLIIHTSDLRLSGGGVSVYMCVCVLLCSNSHPELEEGGTENHQRENLGAEVGIVNPCSS